NVARLSGSCGPLAIELAAIEKLLKTTSVAPFWRALFHECVDALVRVGVEQAASHHTASEVVRLSQTQLDLPVERPLALRNKPGALGQDDARQYGDRGVELRFRDDAIDEAPRQRRRSVDRLTRQQHLHHPLACDITRDTDGGRRAKHADVPP